MASYFELPTRDNAATAVRMEDLPAEERKQLGRMSMMSPVVSKVLEDLDDEDSDSSSEGGSLFHEEHLAVADDKKNEPAGPLCRGQKEFGSETNRQTSSLSLNGQFVEANPSRDPGRVSVAPARSGGGGPARQKPTHMARFHSLRSMLFQANIEDKMKTITREDSQKEEVPTNKWKSQHDERQMHRSRTPGVETDGKEKTGNRIRTKIQRLTSREVPVMSKIGEDDASVEFDDRASTASSDSEIGHQEQSDADGDAASINDSDVEELARWVSRGNSAGTRVIKGNAVVPKANVDSGHESVGQSDVEDLVRQVSQRSAIKGNQGVIQYARYSDASTESDSSDLVDNSSEEEEDAEDLVRWISHRDGARAGPVRRNLERPELDPEVEQYYDSNVPELGRWFNRHDDTSGESAASSPAHNKPYFLEEEPRGRSREREAESPVTKQKNHLTEDDVDDLVRWVSTKSLR